MHKNKSTSSLKSIFMSHFKIMLTIINILLYPLDNEFYLYLSDW